MLHMQGVYGTRSSAALTVRSSGEVSFYEHYLDDDSVWKDHAIDFRIRNKLKQTKREDCIELSSWMNEVV